MNRQIGKKVMPRHRGWQLVLLVAAILCGGVWLAMGQVAFAQASYDYTVLQGDNWDSVAATTGVSVEALQAANPEAAERESGWLLVGETLTVPSIATSTPSTPAIIHKVESGESWNSIANDYNVSVGLLRAANPQAIRQGNILYRGEELIIPVAGAASAPPAATSTPAVVETATGEASETVTATAESEATEEATAEVVEEATPTETPEATETVTESVDAVATVVVEASSDVTTTAEMTETSALTATEGVTVTDGVTSTGESASGTTSETAFDLPECPERFADYSELMTELINSAQPDGVEAVLAFLSNCGALVDDGVQMADLTGDGVDELVVVYQNPSEEQIFVEGDLVIFNSTADGYLLGYRARAAGEVRLLTVADINLDELPDVAWVDTTCGASTCFDTVNVRSWDGTTWADWTDGTITMAYAEINLSDVSEAGLGEEITLEGGIYGSVGAGPQRSRTEVWSSLEGGPYSLAEKSYSQTECLYHTVLDANRAFLDAPTNGFEAAVALYTQAVDDEGLIKCWVRNDELAELRSFSLFRLALIAGYSGDATTAAAQIDALTAQYPGSIYDGVGQLWLESYTASEDAGLACEDVAVFAEEDSASWEMLADYGYTNPSFEAVDVCPILELDAAQ